jgi:NAD dependent epimerase/dehydratase family enzyme
MNLKDLYKTLPIGKENALHISHINWGMSKRRAQEVINEKMNKANLIVCSSAGGYYRPETKEELNEYYDKCHKHTKKCERRDYRIKTSLNNWR